jgi:indole-3-glycerol phosphate synthase
MTILDKIIANTKIELNNEMTRLPLVDLRRHIESMQEKRPSFLKALKQDGINIIAEVKKASPSKGLICHDFNPNKIARDYERGGACAISVLTDEKFFQGNLSYLDDIAEEISLPLLRKDFIIHEYQIYQAKAHHASAILLLAAVLDSDQLNDLTAVASSQGLDVLLEVHNFPELEKALQTPAKIIGVNNRDLRTFNVDLKVSKELAQHIPADLVKVSESGIFSRTEIFTLKSDGFDAFLIGESLMRQDHRIAALIKLRGA